LCPFFSEWLSQEFSPPFTYKSCLAFKAEFKCHLLYEALAFSFHCNCSQFSLNFDSTVIPLQHTAPPLHRVTCYLWVGAFLSNFISITTEMHEPN
jgi:hypothetical protein